MTKLSPSKGGRGGGYLPSAFAQINIQVLCEQLTIKNNYLQLTAFVLHQTHTLTHTHVFQWDGPTTQLWHGSQKIQLALASGKPQIRYSNYPSSAYREMTAQSASADHTHDSDGWATGLLSKACSL